MKTPNQIYKVMCIPLKEFNSQIKQIKNICQHYDVNHYLDDHTNELLIYFYDPKSFNAIKQEIQLKVVDVDFNSQPKYVRMSLKMKTPIIDDTPPKWFLQFRNEMLGFKNEMLGFKNEMSDFKQEVLVRLDRIDFRINNLVKLNNLKE